jgi:hypothetical protein
VGNWRADALFEMRERRACLAIGLLPPPQDGVRPGAPTDVRVAYAEGYAPFSHQIQNFRQ